MVAPDRRELIHDFMNGNRRLIYGLRAAVGVRMENNDYFSTYALHCMRNARWTPTDYLRHT